MEETIYFDLATERVIILEDRNRHFALKCRRITSHDWLAYFNAMVFTAEQEGRTRVTTNNWEALRLDLVESVLIGAEGYKVSGGAELTSILGWQKKIPLSHRQRLGSVLTDVRTSQSEDDGFTIYPEGEVVLLDTTYTAVDCTNDDGGPGRAMQSLRGLKHVFTTPTEEQHRRYARESSRSKVVGGTRTGKTIYQGSQALLAKLYDELIVSVEGYSVSGVPLTDNKAVICSEMDTLHKVIAAQEIFQPQDTSSLAGGDEQ